MFAVTFLEKLSALTVNTTLGPVTNMLADTACYITNSPRSTLLAAFYAPAMSSTVLWNRTRLRYEPYGGHPVCDMV